MDTKPLALAPEENITLTFSWDTPDIPKICPYPVYIISANATLADDSDPRDNVKVARAKT